MIKKDSFNQDVKARFKAAARDRLEIRQSFEEKVHALKSFSCKPSPLIINICCVTVT